MPLHKAAWKGRDEIAKVRPSNLLFTATTIRIIADGTHVCLQVLLAAGADPNAVQQFGRSPLHTAAGYGRGIVAGVMRNLARAVKQWRRCLGAAAEWR